MININLDIGFFVKRFKLWFWWTFEINKNEFHPSLNIKGNKVGKILNRRKLAHLLSTGYTPWNIPSEYLEGF